MNTKRVMLAAIAAPLLAPIPFLLFSWWENGMASIASELATMGTLAAIIYCAGLAVSLVLGIPSWWLFERMGWRHPLAYAAGGMVLGSVGGWVVLQLLLGEFQRPGQSPPWPALMLFGACGLLAALLFWAIAVRQQPSSRPA